MHGCYECACPHMPFDHYLMQVIITQDLLTPPSLTCTAQPVTAAALGVQWMKGGILLMLLLAFV